MHDETHPLGLLLSLGLGGLLSLEELLESILRQRIAVGIKPDLGHLLRGRLGGGCSFGHGAQVVWIIVGTAASRNNTSAAGTRKK